MDFLRAICLISYHRLIVLLRKDDHTVCLMGRILIEEGHPSGIRWANLFHRKALALHGMDGSFRKKIYNGDLTAENRPCILSPQRKQKTHPQKQGMAGKKQSRADILRGSVARSVFE